MIIGVIIIVLVIAGVLAVNLQDSSLSSLTSGTTSSTGSHGYKITNIDIGNSTSPLKLAYNPFAKVVYVADMDSGKLFTINTLNNTLNPNVTNTGAQETIGLTFDSSNLGIYLSSVFNHNVVFLNSTNLSNNATTIPVSGRPGDILFSPGSKLLYVTIGDGSALITIGSNNSIQGNPISATCPTGLAYDSINRAIYVSNSCSGSVFVVSEATRQVIANISVGANPIGLAFDSKDETMFVANANSNSVSVINCSSLKVSSTIPLGNQSLPVQVAYDSSLGEVFVSDGGTNNVSVIQTSNFALVASINLPGRPYGILYDPDNGGVYVANGHEVSVIVKSN